MQIITRAAWGARAPKSAGVTVPWSDRVGVAIHHSATGTDATVRAIQNGDMDDDGFTDIGYNWLVDQTGHIYEGRKGTWTVRGAHAGGQNTAWIGVCWIGDGRKTAPSAAAKKAIRWIWEEACRRAGRTLDYRGHGQVPGQATACPGEPLKDWIAKKMPVGTAPAKPTTPKPTPPPATGSTDWTQEVIMSLPTLKRGSKGAQVKRAQALLNTEGAGLVEDGDFGPKTGAKTREFQKKKGLAVDELIGKHTWTRLISG